MIDRNFIGRKFTPFSYELERSRLKAFAHAIGETNPIYSEFSSASAAGLCDQLAPPTFTAVIDADSNSTEEVLTTLQIDKAKLLHVSQEFEYFAAIFAGDSIAVTTHISDIYEKKDGALEFVEVQRDYCNQHGALLVRSSGMLVLRNSSGARKAHSAQKPDDSQQHRKEAEEASEGELEAAAMASVSVGSEIPSLSLPPINRTDLRLYAEASGDHNPMHIDSDFARSAGMPDVIAHGMLSMAYLGRVLTNWVPQHVMRKFSARFVAVTQLHDTMTCSGNVVELIEAGGKTLARCELQAANQRGEKTLLGEALVAL